VTQNSTETPVSLYIVPITVVETEFATREQEFVIATLDIMEITVVS